MKRNKNKEKMDENLLCKTWKLDRKSKFTCIADENIKCVDTLENNLAVPKFNMEILYDSAVSQWGIYPRELKTG